MAAGSGLVLRRARSQRLVVLAAFGTILLATTVLSALTVYASSVTDSGVDRILADASFDDVGTKVTGFLKGDDYPSTDRTVRQAVATAYGQDSTLTIYASGHSSSYARAAEVGAATPDLIAFGFYTGIEDYARLVGDGASWPSRGSDNEIVEAALPVAAAKPLGLVIGSELEIANRVTKSRLTVRITGLFEPIDATDAFWRADPLLLTGARLMSFRTYGPLVVSEQAFLANLGDDQASALWLVEPTLGSGSAAQLDAMLGRFDELPSALGADDPRSAISVSVRLPETLAQLKRARLVARSTMLIPVLQLVVLAGYALLLTSRLLAEHRRTEVALLRARGAATSQIAALGIREGLLLAAPAALLAPLLTVPLLELVGRTTAAARVDVPTISPTSWLVASLAALFCALALTVPSLRGAGTYVESQQARGRGQRRSALQRAGGDLALLVVAVLAFIQLRHYGGPVVSVAGDEPGQTRTLGFDPLIAAGPALGLLAGGILALRLVPILSRAAEAVTTRRTGLAPALGAWQVSRRPLRYAGPALLLVMATSIGLLSVVTTATWRRSQQDQADFQSGADLRVMTTARDETLTVPGTAGWLSTMPGVGAISPAMRATGEFGTEPVEVVALDAASAPELLKLRSDLGDGRPLGQLVAPLAEPAPLTAAALVPGEPEALMMSVRATPHGPIANPAVTLTTLVRDARDLVYALPPGTVRADGDSNEVVLPLSGAAGRLGDLSYPISIVGFQVDYHVAPGANPGALTLVIERASGSATASADGQAGDGDPVTVPDGAGWIGAVAGPYDRYVSTPGLRTAGSLLTADLPPSGPITPEEVGPGPSLLGVRASFLLAGADVPPDPFGANGTSSQSDPAPPPMPALVTADLLASDEGRGLAVEINGDRFPLRVAGVVDALPTTTGSGVLVDYQNFVETLFLGSGEVDRPTEWWLASTDPAQTAAALREQNDLVSTVQDRVSIGEDLRNDPLSGGLQGALLLGFGAALAFAAIGFAVNATVSARERLTEFALLRALGVSSRQVFGLLGVEQAFLAVLGIAGGLVLGLVVADLMVPMVVGASQATIVRPDVVLVTNWLLLAAMLATVVVVLVAIVGLLAGGLRRRGLGATLRIGEDR